MYPARELRKQTEELGRLKRNSSKFIMENIWSDGIVGERKDLAPIMEEEDKGQAKGSFFLSIQSLYTSCITLLLVAAFGKRVPMKHNNLELISR